MKAYLDRWALRRVMKNHSSLIPDIKLELKRTAKWEPHISELLIRILKVLDPKRPDTQ